MITLRSFLLGTAVVVSLSVVPCAAQVDWSAARSFEAPDATGRMAAADFDRDGRQDLVVHVRDSFGPAIYVYLARDGSLLVPEVRRIAIAPFPAGIDTPSLHCLDLDSDGNPDIVRHSGSVSVLFGDGAGAFSEETELLAENLARIALLDANGDGRLDIAASDATSGSVRVALQDASDPRRFDWFSSIPVESRWLVAADFNGDGKTDLAIGRSTAAITFLRGEGDGRFTVGVSLDTVLRPGELVLAELGGGPLPDLVAPAGLFLRSVLGSASQGLTLGTATPIPSAMAEFVDSRLAAADVDGDERTDLIVPADGGIRVYRSLDGGGFDAPRSWVGAGISREVLAADFTGDGLVDVASKGIESQGSGFLHVFPGRHGSDFVAPYRIALRAEGVAVATADFDVDGNVDFAIAMNSEPNALDISFGDGRGGVRETIAAGPPRNARGPIGWFVIAAGDVTGDGLPDIVTAQDGILTVTLGGGTTFTEAGSVDAGYVFAWSGVRLADTDGDGVSNVIFLGLESVAVFTVDAAGAFTARTDIPIPPGNGYVIWVDAADVNGDGVTDLMISAEWFVTLHVALGTGAGGFLPPTPIPSFAGLPGTFDVADVDGDGLLDIVAHTRLVAPGTPALLGLEVALALPAGGFAPATFYSAGAYGPGLLVVADVTGDGAPDVVGSQGRRLVIFPGEGAGGIGLGHGLTADLPYWASQPVQIADFDGDGQMDFFAFAEDNEALVIITARRSSVVDALRGTVGLASGTRSDVLFVNESTGDAERVLTISSSDALTVRLDAAPSSVASRFALYAWAARPDASTLGRLPFGLGTIALGMPLGGFVQPRAVFNNAGHPLALGAATHPSSPAPSTVISRSGGVGRAITFTLQGIMADPGALNGRAAVTNGVVVVSR